MIHIDFLPVGIEVRINRYLADFWVPELGGLSEEEKKFYDSIIRLESILKQSDVDLETLRALRDKDLRELYSLDFFCMGNDYKLYFHRQICNLMNGFDERIKNYNTHK